MVAPLAEYFPPGLVPDGAPVAHPEPAAYRRRVLDPDEAARLACALRVRAPLRCGYPGGIPAALDAVHARWSAVRSGWREEAVELLRAATGYPAAVLDRHLRSTFAGLRSPRRGRWLTDALPSGAATSGGPEVRPGPPGLVVVVSSGNIPAAALPSVVQALILGAPCLVKCSSSEPFLLPLYARSVAELAPDLVRGLVVTGWPGGAAELERRLLANADALVAYGGDAALRELRERLPLHARYIGYGHRLSFSAVGREALAPRAARRLATGIALDAALFDQQGCLSPQTVYVERGGAVSPAELAELVAGELERLERRLPRRRLTAAESAAIHQFRVDLEMRAFLDPGLRLWSSRGGTAWTVALERETALQPCPLNRTVVLRPVEALEELPALASGARTRLLSAGLAAASERRAELAAALLRSGVTRIARIGRAQRPEEALYHDGVEGIIGLTRYGVIER